MALIVDQQSSGFKHFCKICKKGFGCGRALGGHMRAHGMGDETLHLDDDDPASDWEDNKSAAADVAPPDSNNTNNNKRLYALRANPNRLKSCRVCENCGKEFLSWKSFLEHGKCSSDDAESLISSPGSDGDYDYDDDGDDGGGQARRGCAGWSKRKRSLRAKVCPSSEEEDLANCLMMLSNATVDPTSAEPEESCASASKEEQDMMRIRNSNFVSPTFHHQYRTPPTHQIINYSNNKVKGVAKGTFECKACKKVFTSHQALGGHRASHKKVKGCFAARLDQGSHDSLADEDVITQEEFFPTKSNSTRQFDRGADNNAISPSSSKRKSKVHECSICHRVFSSGQALGGHKRCHWITSNSPDASSWANKFQQFQDHLDQIQQRPNFVVTATTTTNNNNINININSSEVLDLNLPAPTEHHATNNLSSLEVSTDIHLQPWLEAKEKDHRHHHDDPNEDANNNIKNEDVNSNDNNNVKNNDCEMLNADDEADSKVKLAKLSELKDINMGGSSSAWLQVGIGSTADVGAAGADT